MEGCQRMSGIGWPATCPIPSNEENTCFITQIPPALRYSNSNLRKKEDETSKDECKKIENELADSYSKEYIDRIEKESKYIDPENGGFNTGHLWKLKKEMFPQGRDLPTAMLDRDGILQTDIENIKSVALDAYKYRLRNRTIKPGLEALQQLKENVCILRLKKSQRKRTQNWTMDDLNVVLSHLKKDASRDPLGYANELFNPNIAGDDLKKALLSLMNEMKEKQVFPEALKSCNITSIWKRKGPKNNFESYRGIFRITVLRNILDRLIYNDEYPKIDSYLSDCNVGGRKGRNVRDNIFVLNAIMNSISKGIKEPHDVQVYDLIQCFDSMWLKECINSLY